MKTKKNLKKREKIINNKKDNVQNKPTKMLDLIMQNIMGYVKIFFFVE
jgi:hypothetical protein